jgi:hypothetical protein
MQGYLISRPIPPEQVVELLRPHEKPKTDAARGKASAVAGKSKGSKNRKKRR